MSYKKIIPCLDVNQGKVVKGVKFVDLRDAGNPAELASAYDQAGADEIVFLDISATVEGRETRLDWVRRTAERVRVPFTVGGGIRSLGDMRVLFNAGATKVSINTAAVSDPSLIARAAAAFGSERIIVAVDVKTDPKGAWEVVTHGGQIGTEKDAVEWCRNVESLGAGEILLTSLDRDGTKDGYDLEVTRAVSEAVGIPVIASGGAGTLQHLLEGITEGLASGVLAASIFHFGEFTISEAKDFLSQNGVKVKK